MALDQLHVVIPCRSMVSGMTGSRAFEPLSPMIVVDHPVALADQDVVIELCGFPQHELVTVTATMEGGSKWQARAAYLTDDDGKVSICPPVAGVWIIFRRVGHGTFLVGRAIAGRFEAPARGLDAYTFPRSA
jgi:hypothetical protein